MVQSNEILVDRIFNDLHDEIQKTYLEEEDIKQEIRFALFALPNLSRVKRHIKKVLKNFPKDRTIHESSGKLTWLLIALVERCELMPQTVLKLKYGLIDGTARSNPEIAKRFKLKTVDIRKIEAAAITLIQQSPGIDYLKRKFLRIRDQV